MTTGHEQILALSPTGRNADGHLRDIGRDRPEDIQHRDPLRTLLALKQLAAILRTLRERARGAA